MRDDISYVVIDTLNHALSAYALELSQKRFPLKNVIIFSDRIDCWNGRQVITIPEIGSARDYNKIVFYDLPNRIKTDYALFIQYDGFVLNGELFSEQFLNWDYIGAPWPHFREHNVGNGGFSLRSKKLISKVQEYLLPTDVDAAEDIVICRYLRARLENGWDVRFAPVKVAEMFSYELAKPDFNTFGFHGLSHLPSLMQNNIQTLFDHIQPSSVSKFFRSFRDACEKLPNSHRKLFYDYCIKHQSEMLRHAKLNLEKQSNCEQII